MFNLNHVTMKKLFSKTLEGIVQKCIDSLSIFLQVIKVSRQTGPSFPVLSSEDVIASIKECAAYCKVSERTISRYCQSGLLSFTRNGRQTLFAKKDLDAAIKTIPFFFAHSVRVVKKPKLVCNYIASSEHFNLYRFSYERNKFFAFIPFGYCGKPEFNAYSKEMVLTFNQNYPFKTFPYES
jgi:excisionase family DNA binding protein